MNTEGAPVVKVIFWICALLIVYAYVLYPLVLFFSYALAQVWRDLVYLAGRRDRRTPTLGPDELPLVTILVPAHNEEQVLPQTIENLRGLDYPVDSMQIILVSDGSTAKPGRIL